MKELIEKYEQVRMKNWTLLKQCCVRGVKLKKSVSVHVV